MGRVRVLVVDDHDVVRAGLRWLLRRAPWVESCAGASTTAEAAALARSLEADVALVDVHLGAESGLQTCLELRRVAPGMRVALLSSRWDLVPTRLALDVGALGVVSKEARERELLAAVRTLAGGLEVDVACPYPEPVRLLPSRPRDPRARRGRAHQRRDRRARAPRVGDHQAAHGRAVRQARRHQSRRGGARRAADGDHLAAGARSRRRRPASRPRTRSTCWSPSAPTRPARA